MKKLLALCLAVAFVTLFAGCATKETFFLDRISDDKTLSGVSVDAKQRFVWMPTRPVRYLEKESEDQYTYSVKDRKIVCAEPSPDVASAFASSLSTSLGVALSKVNVDASVARSVSETVQQLTQRTEMLQLLRDAYYRACEAYANGMVGEFGYGLLLNQIDNVMVKMAALNIVGEQRPLPESTQDRQKLEDVKSKEADLSISRDRLSAARDRQQKAEAKLTAAKQDDDAATIKKAGAQKKRDKTNEALANQDEKEKAEMRAQLRNAEVELAAAESAKTLTAGRVTEATTELGNAGTALSQAEAALTASQQALALARKEAAGIVRPPFAPQALKTIENILAQSQGHTTVVGACLMWLSQHLNIQAKEEPNEPAIVGGCRAFLKKAAEPTPLSKDEQSIVGAFRQALEKARSNATNEALGSITSGRKEIPAEKR